MEPHRVREEAPRLASPQYKGNEATRLDVPNQGEQVGQGLGERTPTSQVQNCKGDIGMARLK